MSPVGIDNFGRSGRRSRSMADNKLGLINYTCLLELGFEVWPAWGRAL